MKIVTVNLPEIYIQKIDGLIGNDGLYPSRSELVRVAVREFLIDKLKKAEQFKSLPNGVSKPKMKAPKPFGNVGIVQKTVSQPVDVQEIQVLVEEKEDFEIIHLPCKDGGYKAYKVLNR